MHGSLLPKYRGAAPIQRAVINGEKKTGVTTMKMDKGLDTGEMLFSEEIQIGEYETSEELFERMAQLGAKVLVRTIENIETVTPISQNDEEATYAPVITKEEARIDWNNDARKISKLICGMNSWPIAYTEYKGEMMKIYEAIISDKEFDGIAGEIRACNGEIEVKCGKGVLKIKTLQFSGSKRMSAEDYLRGHSFEKGVVLGM